jgi:hypothetical protein
MAPRMSRQRHIIGCDMSFDDSCMPQSSSESKRKGLACWTNADVLSPSVNGLMVKERQKGGGVQVGLSLYPRQRTQVGQRDNYFWNMSSFDHPLKTEQRHD